MIIKFPKGTIADIDGYDFHIKKKVCVEIIDDQIDCYIGEIVQEYLDQLNDEDDKAEEV